MSSSVSPNYWTNNVLKCEIENNKAEKMMDKITEFRILDLFCGAGGFSYGMHKNIHFNTVVALDFNESAAKTFKKNMPQTTVVVGDITDSKIKEKIIYESELKKVNMIIC